MRSRLVGPNPMLLVATIVWSLLALASITVAAQESGEENPDPGISFEQATVNLNLARAADAEIARQLDSINSQVNLTLEKISRANIVIAEAEVTTEQTDRILSGADENRAEIESAIVVQALTGFKSQNLQSLNMAAFSEADLNEALRQEQILNLANLSTTQLLEELYLLNEESKIAKKEAAQTKAEAEDAKTVLLKEYENLKKQQAVQLQLKVESERRIEKWAEALGIFSADDASVQEIISNSTSEPTVSEIEFNFGSASDYRWPAEGRISSEFGWRVHPIYGTRRLHAGIDIAAPQGTPVYASAGGKVIFAGTRGGYGKTIMIDHGAGVVTLYAHQSVLDVSEGTIVSQGAKIGEVGTTGASTGNHLHFEVRVEGQANNPRNFLP